ncbi:hypothetical protein LMJ41_16870 [Streptomyces globisporus]|nr:hypothetical protein [Streptomyces globisporus]
MTHGEFQSVAIDGAGAADESCLFHPCSVADMVKSPAPGRPDFQPEMGVTPGATG